MLSGTPITVTFLILSSFFMSLSWKPRSKSCIDTCGEFSIFSRSVSESVRTSFRLRIVSIRIKWSSSGRFSVGSR